MDVSVLSKYGQRSLRPAARASVLGNGLLERTRSTSLALLGLTAAIGLAMVALALNQGWPLIPGAPIPGLGGGHEAVGEASVAAPAKGRAGRQAVVSLAPGQANSATPGSGSGRPDRSVALGGSRSPQAAGLVVSHPTRSSPTGDPGGGAVPETPQASAPPTVAAAPLPAPEAVPASNPSSSPEPVAHGAPESPVPAQTPPPTDNGEGQDHGRHLGRGGGGHGHGHSGGGEHPGAPEPGESPETNPVPSEAPPPETDAPEESGGPQSHPPSPGHGGGHGSGHGHW